LRKKLVSFFLLLLLAGFKITAQNPYIQHYTSFDELPSNAVYQAYQDSRKFIWFATDAGVARFDGSRFTVYRKKDGLNSNDIVRVKEDSFGRIWFFNMNATLNFYKDGIIYNGSNAPFLDSLVSKEFFRDFYQDDDKTIYFYYNYQRDIFTLDSGDHVKKYKLPAVLVPNIVSQGFIDVMVIRYLGISKNQDICLWTIAGIYRTSSLYDKPVLVNNEYGFKAVYPSASNKLYAVVGTGKSSSPYKVVRYVNENVADDSFHSIPLGSEFISSIFEDVDGILWISTFDQGVFCYMGNEIIRHFDIREAQAVIQDHEKNIWVTSLKDGVYKINPYQSRHLHYEKSIFEDRGILSLARHNNDGIWLTNGKTVYLLRDGSFYSLELHNQEQTLNQLLQVSDNKLIVGELGTKHYAIEGIHADANSKKLSYDRVNTFSIAFKKLSVNVTGTQISSGSFFSLALMDPENPISDIRSIDLGERIYNTFYNSDNELVVNTKSLYLYKNDSLIRDESLAFFDNKIISGHLILNDSAELYSLEGDSIYIIAHDRLYNLTAAWNYPADLHIRYLDYHPPTLFIGTSSNIFLCDNPLNILSGGPVLLHPVDISFRTIHDMLFEGDRLYIASDDGLTAIAYQELMAVKSYPPIPYFQSLRINNEPGVPQNSKVVLTGSNRIHIDFNSINYSISPVIYSYRLKGLDREWQNSSGTSVLYESLPAGEYVFELKARKPTSEWSEPIDFTIRIERTFWQHPLFLMIITLLLAGIVFLAVLWRKNQEMKRREVEHQLVLLEQRALQSMMNPHFIFNSLGSIQSYLLQKKHGEAGLYLSRFARLIRQNLNAIDAAMINLGEEVDRLKNYLDLEKLRMEDRFDYRIEVAETIESGKIMIPSMIVQPFVENSIWHGISSMKEQGMITVAFSLEDERSLKLIVEDNGIGLVNASKFLGKEDNHLKMGMAVTRKRIELLGKKYGIKPRVDFSEISPGSINPGTRVELIVPFSYGQEQ
jgi:two-component sensor histidine kinase